MRVMICDAYSGGCATPGPTSDPRENEECAAYGTNCPATSTSTVQTTLPNTGLQVSEVFFMGLVLLLLGVLLTALVKRTSVARRSKV